MPRKPNSSVKRHVVDVSGDEEWRPIVGFDGYYSVSNWGRVRSEDRVVPRPGKTGPFLKRRGAMVAQNIYLARGYPCVCLTKFNRCKLYLVHRLVAGAFLTNPLALPQIDHINGVRHDNRVGNLRWATSRVNSLNHRRVATNRSGVVGVYFNPKRPRSPWYVFVGPKYFGAYKTKTEAARVRELAHSAALAEALTKTK